MFKRSRWCCLFKRKQPVTALSVPADDWTQKGRGEFCLHGSLNDTESTPLPRFFSVRFRPMDKNRCDPLLLLYYWAARGSMGRVGLLDSPACPPSRFPGHCFLLAASFTPFTRYPRSSTLSAGKEFAVRRFLLTLSPSQHVVAPRQVSRAPRIRRTPWTWRDQSLIA